MGVSTASSAVSTGSSTARSRAPSRPRSSRSRSPRRCSASATTGRRSWTAAADGAQRVHRRARAARLRAPVAVRRTAGRRVLARWCASTRRSRATRSSARSRSSLEEASDLDTGLFRIRSDVALGAGARSGAAGGAPAGADQLCAGVDPQRVRRDRARRPTVRLDKASTTIGRAPDCDLQIDDPGISRRARPDRARRTRPGDRPRLHQRHLGRRPAGPAGDALRRCALALGSTNFVVRLG